MWFPHLTVLQTGAQEVPSERQERFCAVQIDGALAQVTQRLWDLLLVDLQKPLECGPLHPALDGAAEVEGGLEDPSSLSNSEIQ